MSDKPSWLPENIEVPQMASDADRALFHVRKAQEFLDRMTDSKAPVTEASTRLFVELEALAIATKLWRERNGNGIDSEFVQSVANPPLNIFQASLAQARSGTFGDLSADE